MLETLKSKNPKKKIAIILFNLGGPDSLAAVKPFLFNLFYDKAIINLPNPFRYLIAKMISTLRNEKSKAIYALIGNRSPILAETQAQKQALAERLKLDLADNFEIFIMMRHFHPMKDAVMKQIKQYNPSEIILLPLYPQFSSTTTGSSISDFINHYHKYSLSIPIKTVCCYPLDKEFIKSHVSLIKQSIEKITKDNFCILFSAHGLPIKIIAAGDPYQWQVQQTVKAVVNELNIEDLDYKITYQSRVGPVEWLKPNTEEEIEKAAMHNKALIIVPIAFVSEHVETLVELDIEYKEIADKYKTPYIRVPALRVNEIFIDSLAKIVLNAVNQQSGSITSSMNKKLCPSNFTMCPCSK